MNLHEETYKVLIFFTNSCLLTFAFSFTECIVSRNRLCNNNSVVGWCGISRT